MNFTISLFTNKADNAPKRGLRSWEQLCAKFAAPMVRQEKDGLLFSPALFDPARRLNANVKELSLLVLDCDHKAPGITNLANAVRLLLLSLDTSYDQLRRGFAIYSTHSHRQTIPCVNCEASKAHKVCTGNPTGEPRYRVIIPLATPVPVASFSALWQWAAAALPVDPQAKDPARIYYTPAKFCDEAPYDYWIEPGAPLDWKAVFDRATDSGGQSVAAPAPAAFAVPFPPSAPGDFLTHEDRHAELCRRIMARGKRNGRGNYDARCIAHGGRGETGLMLNPNEGEGAVSCNAKCAYQDILRAEGLTDHYLPSRDQESAGLARSQPSATVPMIEPPPRITGARLDLIYSLLLSHCFELSHDDADRVQAHWGSPYGDLIEWPGTGEHAAVKVCSYPTLVQQWAAAARLAQDFDLTGVPGFFYLRGRLPGEQGAQQRSVSDAHSRWRINLPPMRKPGALLSPYNNESGFIVGVRIHRNVNDAKTIWLLSSKGLPGGARALAFAQEAAA